MPDGNILLTLKQINICIGKYEDQKLAENHLTFGQAFLLNELYLMDKPCVCSTELSERVGFAKSSISRTLKELKKNGYVRMNTDRKDNRKKRIALTPKAHEAEADVKEYLAELSQCLVQQIPEQSLPKVETALQTILGNIQQETLRRPI